VKPKFGLALRKKFHELAGLSSSGHEQLPQIRALAALVPESPRSSAGPAGPRVGRGRGGEKAAAERA